MEFYGGGGVQSLLEPSAETLYHTNAWLLLFLFLDSLSQVYFMLPFLGFQGRWH